MGMSIIMPAADKIRLVTTVVMSAFLWVSFALHANAAEVRIAVAANFTAVATEIAEAFEAKSGHVAVLSFGSTGQLYSQISQGAPFDVFLAADQIHPQKIHDAGMGSGTPPITYAIGKIVLWSLDPALIQGDDALQEGNFDHLAIANPETAPYGKAAMETLQALGLAETLKPRLVRGNNVAQTFQFIATGNAELGFIAQSQAPKDGNGSQWIIPENLYQPIRQDAVLLRDGASNEAAIAFLDYLTGPKAIRIIKEFGYGTSANGSSQ